MTVRSTSRKRLMMCTALTATGLCQVAPAFAQTAPASATGSAEVGLEEIIVTAQKREQSLQDVPIAITALSEASLQANRVTNVTDLNGLAPNLTVRSAAGGSAIPAFSMRGITSFGVVPGSDKEISIYLDGVYLGSPRGSTFELPDIARIEVLRGPQGTLFGRNATAGAISITTRDPKGDLGFQQQLTVGNYGQMRTRTTIDTPAVGPFSAYVSYVHDERRGDIRNLGVGTVWDRTGPKTNVGALTSPRYLGNKDLDSFLVAVKFEPTDDFSMTYKFDNAVNHFTPEGVAFIGYSPAAPLVGSLETALIGTTTVPVLNGQRPETVNNSFTTPGVQRNTGHSLTAEWRLSDSVTLKNVAAYRTAYVNTATQLDGLGGLTFTPAALGPYATFAVLAANPSLATNPNLGAIIGNTANSLVPLLGSRFCVVCNNVQSYNQQWSDELQLIYTSQLLTLTVGALYYRQKDSVGVEGLRANFSYTPLPTSGRLPLGGQGQSFNTATSLAAYAQAEVHVTPRLDVIGGIRITQDKKTANFVTGGTFVPGPNGFADGTFTGLVNNVAAPYDRTDPNYSIGINFKPIDNTLLYGKFSTAIVSGGSIGGVNFEPETVASWEIGFKGDFLDRRLRTNLSLFTAKYKHVQSAQSGSNVGFPQLGTVVIDAGDQRSKGFEVEISALPVNGLTLSGSLGYTDTTFINLSPILYTGVGLTAANASLYRATISPWTGSLSGQYETAPLFNGARLVLRADATWHSRRVTDSNPTRQAQPVGYDQFYSIAPSWTVNSRIALRDIQIGPGNVEVAIWARNLFNNKEFQFPLSLGATLSSTFVAARTFGLDVGFKF